MFNRATARMHLLSFGTFKKSSSRVEKKVLNIVHNLYYEGAGQSVALIIIMTIITTTTMIVIITIIINCTIRIVNKIYNKIK